ncbi:Phospho-2-dehydro-3-deoxyheptonate aldolase 1 [Nymphaea thermarum]|nr:Phospho-2-dehydro-3-deoxyheptonate aldolase 1 [Nymphaea thermarum]
MVISGNGRLSKPPLMPRSPKIRPKSVVSVRAVRSTEPLKPGTADLGGNKGGSWAIDSWKLKKALQIPQYPNKQELEEVLNRIESSPPPRLGWRGEEA